MVAHDRCLLKETGAEIWALDPHGISVYDNFIAYDQDRKSKQIQTSLTEQNATKQIQQPKEDQKKSKREQAEKRNALYRALKPLQDRYDALEIELTQTAESQESAEKQLADPQIFADPQKSGVLLKEFEELRQKADLLMNEMDSLEKEMETIKNQTVMPWTENLLLTYRRE